MTAALSKKTNAGHRQRADSAADQTEKLINQVQDAGNERQYIYHDCHDNFGKEMNTRFDHINVLLYVLNLVCTV